MATITNLSLNFNFDTTYNGSKMNLTVVADDDRYSVLHQEKPFGHIKLGAYRDTWIVVDSKYVAPQLINEIRTRIQNRINNG